MEIHLSSQAEEDSLNLQKQDRIKVVRKLKYLEKDVYQGKKLSGKLTGFYSLRSWPFRIIYIIKNNSTWIVHIDHRKKVYK